jgi:DNA (cytosine-5)-methyltransferase 1
MVTVKPRLLDLYCCAGGAAKGYADAGFEVTGVDRDPQPQYPFEFVEVNALTFLRERMTWIRRTFLAVHASPPCQKHSALTKGTNKGRVYEDFLAPTRVLLEELGLPYVMENVAGAPLRKDLMLCGEMFGLRVIRHRYFEFGGALSVPRVEHPAHRGRVAGMRHGEWFEGPYFAVYGDGGGKGSVKDWQDAMGIHWTSVRKEIAEAIPPAYTRFIGEHMMKELVK